MFFTYQLVKHSIKKSTHSSPFPSALVTTKTTLFFLSSSYTKLPLTVRVLQCCIRITLIRIWILIKVIPNTTLIPLVYRQSTHHWGCNFDFNTDLDTGIHSNANPDSDAASQNNADPDPLPWLYIIPTEGDWLNNCAMCIHGRYPTSISFGEWDL
jgi:hypothetical protein